jgi:hypothetical protein
MESTEFPWLKHLPEEDLEPFLKELAQVAVHAISVRDVKALDVKALDTIVAAWRSTAEALSDPEVAEVLLNPSEGDFGEALPPKHWFGFSHQDYDSVTKTYTNICGECQGAEGGVYHHVSMKEREDAEVTPDTLRAFINRMSDLLGEMSTVQRANRDLAQVIEAKNRALETVDGVLDRRDRQIAEQREALRELEEQLNRVRNQVRKDLTDCYDTVAISDLQRILGETLQQTNKYGGGGL